MSDQPALEERLKGLIIERLFLKDIEPSDIGDEDELMERLGVDSVQVSEIVVGLEEEFEVIFDEEEFDIEIFKSVKSIADAVREKQTG